MAEVSIQPELFGIEGGGRPTLKGTHCRSCSRRSFPPSGTCPWCGGEDTEQVELSRTGTLWGWTAVSAAPPGYRGPVPYGFGIVELPADGLRLITRLTVADPTTLTYGQPVELVADALHTDEETGATVVSWAFAPAAPAPAGFAPTAPRTPTDG
ncbi:MAG: OB-fold domain-containing protein [Acidimicrobiales bacterium]